MSPSLRTVAQTLARKAAPMARDTGTSMPSWPRFSSPQAEEKNGRAEYTTTGTVTTMETQRRNRSMSGSMPDQAPM